MYNRQSLKIEMEFQRLLNVFHPLLFAHSTGETIENCTWWKRLNEIWIKFCIQWNADKNHIAKANPEAFYNYSIKQ